MQVLYTTILCYHNLRKKNWGYHLMCILQNQWFNIHKITISRKSIIHPRQRNHKLTECQLPKSQLLSKSTTEVIFFLRKLTRIYCKRKEDLPVVFIDLNKAYEYNEKSLQWALKKTRIHKKNTIVILDMYKVTVTSVRTIIGDTKGFH